MTSFTASLIVASTFMAPANQSNHQAHLQAWAKDFLGQWTTEFTAEEDRGPLKEGDKYIAKWVTKWSPDKDALMTNYWQELDGSTFVTVKAVIGWDPMAEAVVSQWFASNGSAGKIVYTKNGSGWVAKWSMADTEKKTSSWTSHITVVDEKTHELRATDRIMEGERRPDGEARTATRK